MESRMSVRVAIVAVLLVSAGVRPGIAEAQVKPAVSVLVFQNLHGARVPEEERERLADALAISLVESDRVRVLERQYMPADVDYIAVGTIERSRTMFLLTVELMDARSSAAITRIPVQEPIPTKRRPLMLPRAGRGGPSPIRAVLAIAAARGAQARATQGALNVDRVAARLSIGILNAIEQRSTR
jgi:hypothetical protein